MPGKEVVIKDGFCYFLVEIKEWLYSNIHCYTVYFFAMFAYKKVICLVKRVIIKLT